MRTLDTFYQSREWRKLMEIIKLERLNDEDQLICEHCGKPIVSNYDCIGHHVIQLTQSNVNDAVIALNQENIQLVHHRCHNLIHNKLGHQERQVYLVYGAPCSGKSSFVRDAMNVGDFIVDIDSIWECVSGMPRYIKPQRLKSVVFGIRDHLLEDVMYRRGKWLNAYIIGGYPYAAERERICRKLGARTIFINETKETCIDRLMMANDGRNVKEWKRFIVDWFEYASPHTFHLTEGRDNC